MLGIIIILLQIVGTGCLYVAAVVVPEPARPRFGWLGLALWATAQMLPMLG